MMVRAIGIELGRWDGIGDGAMSIQGFTRSG